MPTASSTKLDLPQITVRVLMGDGSIGEGTMTGASAGLVTTVFETQGAPLMPIGHEGLLSIMGGGCTALLQYTVLRRFDSLDGVTYTLRSNVPHHRGWGFDDNRRGALRVVPDSYLSVSISGEGVAASGELLDISRTGAAVRVSQSDESLLYRLRLVDLTLTLPLTPCSAEIVVPATVVNRQQDGSHVRYGFAFALENDPNAEGITSAIADYVHQRQVDMIRVLKDMIEHEL
jgi:hypothetical protein